MVPIFLLPTVVILHVFEAPLVIFIYIFSVIPILVPRDFSSVVFFSSIILREDRGDYRCSGFIPWLGVKRYQWGFIVLLIGSQRLLYVIERLCFFSFWAGCTFCWLSSM